MNTKPQKNPIKDVLAIVVGFLVLFIAFKLKWMLWVSAIVGITGVFSESGAEFISYGWNKLSKILSYIIPNILLTVIYFLVLFPVAWLSRFGKKIMILKNNVSSTFVNYVGKTDQKYFERPW